jgi:hypothetical protein
MYEYPKRAENTSSRYLEYFDLPKPDFFNWRLANVSEVGNLTFKGIVLGRISAASDRTLFADAKDGFMVRRLACVLCSGRPPFLRFYFI